jgi:phosphatidylglycerophosphate synthase
MARFLKMTSQKGKILDSLADILLWLLTIMGIFFLTNYFLLFLILVIYTFDVYIRNIILLESLKNDDKDQQMSEASIILKVFKIVFNHFDSLSILAFCLIFFPDYILYWVYFETIRRSLSAFKRLSILMTHA